MALRTQNAESLFAEESRFLRRVLWMRIANRSEVRERIVNARIELPIMVGEIPRRGVHEQCQKRDQENRQGDSVRTRLRAFAEQRFATRRGSDERAGLGRSWALFVVVAHFGGGAVAAGVGAVIAGAAAA